MKFYFKNISKLLVIISFGSPLCYGMHKWLDSEYEPKSWTGDKVQDPNRKQYASVKTKPINISKQREANNIY